MTTKNLQSVKTILRSVVTCTLVLLLGMGAVLQPVRADSITDLQNQQKALEQQAKQAAAQAEANKTVAQRAAERLYKVSGQLTDLQSSLQTTEGNIGDTTSQIASQSQQLAGLQDYLRKIQDQAGALVRQLYIAQVSRPDSLRIFSNESISKREQETTQLAVLEKVAKELAAQTQTAQDGVQKTLDDLTQKQRSLQALKDQQDQQKKGLADVRQQQAALQNNAEEAQQQFEAQAQAASARAAQIAQQVKILQTTSNWGSQIISSNESSWYYTQTGNYTKMGNTNETINDIGCLITSVAMVAKYYGHPITPDYIARNGTFTRDGSYYANTPAGMGITLRPGGAVNWATVQSEISKGRPVIVSIYLSSVGALNSDGSSHFVVIKGYANGKYLMHDPIGAGRSYNLNQVRSMILVTN